MLARDERPHLGAFFEARGDLDGRHARLDRLDELVGDAADGDDHRDGHAPLAGRAVTGGDGRVGGHVDVGVGKDDHVVLRAAERLAALAGGGGGLVDVRAIGVEPTKEIAAMSEWASRASTATLSPWTTLKTPSGTPASRSSSTVSIEADGSFSDGFNTKVLPQASAGAHIHIGTIAGKLNGVMPATTPSGWRIW